VRTLNQHQLHDALLQARQYTRAWLDDLDDAAWQVPYLTLINPPLWEYGHVAWFMERWCVRARGPHLCDPPAPSTVADTDPWYDSSLVAHASRWQLDLPNRRATHDYAQAILDATLNRLAQAPDTDAGLYGFRLALAHEGMHAEAFASMRQILGYAAPQGVAVTPEPLTAPAHDIFLAPSSPFELGCRPDIGFVFDNEKWTHAVALAPYAISTRPVTETEYAAFVSDGGYQTAEYWNQEGRDWLARSAAAHPQTWRAQGRQWQRRVYNQWRALDPHQPLTHINAYEAQAYCAWAHRRLPSEAEWEYAALCGAIQPMGVWEWTSTPFAPYPGFEPDCYRDYSAPWFHTHRVMRGASAVTPTGLRHPKFRNYCLPERSDMFVGLRTCAQEND